MSQSIERSAHFSADRRYRYGLWRRWGDGPAVTFIGLNPSTADEKLDDPTIRRCMGFVRAWGYNALYMANLFAYRATKPEDMLAQADPVGPENDAALLAATEWSAATVAAWGVHGKHLGRGQKVREMLEPNLHYLRLTKDGYPGHPLYLPSDLQPVKWTLTGGSRS